MYTYTKHFQTNNDFKTYFDTEKNKLKEGVTRWKEASETKVNKQFQLLHQVWTFHLKNYEYQFRYSNSETSRIDMFFANLRIDSEIEVGIPIYKFLFQNCKKIKIVFCNSY